MRLTTEQIKYLSEGVISELVKRGLVKFIAPPEKAVPFLEQAIADDLRIEDKLNEEVKEILRSYEREIEQGRMDYKTMFDLVKKKLVRERGIVL